MRKDIVSRFSLYWHATIGCFNGSGSIPETARLFYPKVVHRPSLLIKGMAASQEQNQSQIPQRFYHPSQHFYYNFCTCLTCYKFVRHATPKSRSSIGNHTISDSNKSIKLLIKNKTIKLTQARMKRHTNLEINSSITIFYHDIIHYMIDFCKKECKTLLKYPL